MLMACSACVGSLILLLALIVASANGSIHTPTENTMAFYVSPNGSDSNDGTSPGTPWRTLTAASVKLQNPLKSRSSVLPAGNGLVWSLLLQRNATWVNDPLVLDASSGADGGHITLSSYGDSSLPQPLLIQPRALALGQTPCVAVNDLNTTAHLPGSGFTVSNLQFSGCYRGLQLTPVPATEGSASNVVLTNNVFNDIRTPLMMYTPPNPNWSPAIFLSGGTFKNVTITNNVAVRIDVFFTSNAYVDTFLLDGNTVQQCSGNCYGFGRGVNLVMQNSVLLRDMSERLFLYGTTDVIVGSLLGYNALINNDFNARGEYQGGPDGCAFDFETGATGFLIQGNTFSRSWGSGIMIFGHSHTSHNVTIADNIFDHAGCIQNRGDRGGIAVMCPGFHKPSGTIARNTFYTCLDTPAFYINPSVPGCADDLLQVDNVIDGATAMVEMPQLSFNPPSPMDKSINGTFNAIGVSKTPNTTIRYTLDGSKPSETSPILPEHGLHLPWPGPVVAMNIRAFKDGMIPSVTNGAVIELNYVLGRMAPGGGALGPLGALNGELLGHLDEVEILSSNNKSVTVSGWAVDSMLPGRGLGPVAVLVEVDFVPVVTALATEPREDLVKAHVAPNPEHGFNVPLPESAVETLLSPGVHVVQVKAIGCPSCSMPRLLPWSSQINVCDGKVC